MADQGQQNLTGNTSVLELVQTRLAALVPEQLEKPSEKCPPRGEADLFGVANDSMRRLHTLARILASEHNALVSEAMELEKKARGPRHAFVRLLWAHAGGGLNPEEQERLKELRREITSKHVLQEIVNSMFWLEVNLNVPGAAGVSTTLFDDWSLGASPDDGFGIRIISIGGGFPADMPPELAELLGGFPRPH